MGYFKGVVVFIDLLGTKAIVKDFNESLRRTEIFRDKIDLSGNGEYRVISEIEGLRPEIYTFSDCAYFLYRCEDENTKFICKKVLYAMSELSLRLYNKNILFRGGISIGDLYINSSRGIFFGESVNEAYKLESEKAKYPRIVVSKDIVEILGVNIKMIKKDSKDIYYLNPKYLTDIGYKLYSERNHGDVLRKFSENLLEKRGVLEKEKSNDKISKIIEKYNWLLNELEIGAHSI